MSKPLIAEVSMNEKSKMYIAELIALYDEVSKRCCEDTGNKK